MADKPGTKDSLIEPRFIQVADHGQSPNSAQVEAYSLPGDATGNGPGDKAAQQYRALAQKIQQEITPEKFTQLKQVEEQFRQIVKQLPKDQQVALPGKIDALENATTVDERHKAQQAALDTVTDPAAKEQLKAVLDQADKILGPELVADLCQLNKIATQLPKQPDGYTQEAVAQPVGSAKTLAQMEQDYDSHIDKLLKGGDAKTIRDVGHAVLEGNLPALEHLLKGSDQRIAAIANDVNQGLQYVHNPMSLSTTPGHVLLQSPTSDRAIDIDTKKHISVEHNSQVRPDGSMSIDMASIITGDTRQDARSMAEKSMYGNGGRNSWSVTGNAGSYYGDGGAQNYYNRSPGSGAGQWRAPYRGGATADGVAPNWDAGPATGDNLLTQPDATPGIQDRLVRLESAFQAAATPKDGLKASDVAFQALLQEADQNFQKQNAQKDSIEQQLQAALPPEKKQQLWDAMQTVSSDIAKLPPDQQQQAMTALALGDSRFLMQHPVLLEAYSNMASLMKEVGPLWQKRLAIDEAANEKMEVGMFYAKDLAKAGDTRAKDVLSHTYDSLPPALKKQYASNPDFQTIAESVGLFIPDESKPKQPPPGLLQA